MRTGRKIAGSAAALLCGLGLLAGAAAAQDAAPAPPPPGGAMQGPPPGGFRGPERRLEHMKHELNLSDDQTAQIKAIFDDSRSKMEALRSNSSLSPQDRHTQMQAIHQTEEDKIHAVLTPDQKTKYDAMQARMRERMQERRDEAPGEAAPASPPPQS